MRSIGRGQKTAKTTTIPMEAVHDELACNREKCDVLATWQSSEQYSVEWGGPGGGGGGGQLQNTAAVTCSRQDLAPSAVWLRLNKPETNASGMSCAAYSSRTRLLADLVAGAASCSTNRLIPCRAAPSAATLGSSSGSSSRHVVMAAMALPSHPTHASVWWMW